MRKPPVTNLPELEKKPDSHQISMVRSYRLITPLFGGGVEPGVVDETTPIRGSSIRGQLRFWWRAVRGGSFHGDPRQLRDYEERLWGAASTPDKARPSSVVLILQTTDDGQDDQPFVITKNESGAERPSPNEQSVAPPYAAFPLQPTNEDIEAHRPIRKLRQDVQFDLTLRFDATWRADVEAALWAWETFGGVGGRTRRGFGALRCLAVKVDETEQSLNRPAQNDAKAVRAWIKEQIDFHQKVKGRSTSLAWHQHVPHVSPTTQFKLLTVSGNGLDAWHELVRKLQAFRQSREGSKHGPSHWPEPNAVRKLAGVDISEKSPYIGEKFPRAYFGLPIIFHFPQGKPLPDATLAGKNTDRMASALIIRPLWFGGNTSYGLALLIDGPQLPEEDNMLILKIDGGQHEVQANLDTDAEAREIEPLGGKRNVLQAFLDTLEE